MEPVTSMSPPAVPYYHSLRPCLRHLNRRLVSLNSSSRLSPAADLEPSRFHVLSNQKKMDSILPPVSPHTTPPAIAKFPLGFIFRFGIYRPNYYQLALSYDPTRHLTYGILLAKTKDHQFPYLLATLKAKESLCTHPLLLANLVITLSINSSYERIRAADWRLNELEETMGQHEYVNRPMGDPLAIDFIATTRTLNTTSRLLGVERMRLGATILALEMIARETKRLELISIGSRHTDRTRYDERNRAISDLAAYQMNTCQNLILRAEYAEKRVHSQIAVVSSSPPSSLSFPLPTS